MLKVLYVATRWPWPIEMGRQRMIDQTLAFASMFAETHLISFTGAKTPATSVPSHIASTSTLRMSGLPEIAGSLVRRAGLPLQSHLFLSSKAQRGLLEAVERISPDIIFFDMARLFSLGQLIRRRHPDIRLVLDMDDRLSERYRRMLDNKSGNSLGGTFSKGLPGPLRALAALLPKPLLTFERMLMARIERRAKSVFDQILMVSPLEASQMNADIPGTNAIGFPPLIEPRTTQPLDFRHGLRFVAIGNANYGPNFEAFALLDRIAARVKAQAGPDSIPFRFVAAGRAHPSQRFDHVEHAGFVPDIGEFLAHDAVLIAPILNGTGIKTKIIDALEHGVPVITTPLGAEGLDLVPGQHYLSAADEDGFVETLLTLVRSAKVREDLEPMARAARAAAFVTHNRQLLMGHIQTALGEGRHAASPRHSGQGAMTAAAFALLAFSPNAQEVLCFASGQSMPRSSIL